MHGTKSKPKVCKRITGITNIYWTLLQGNAVSTSSIFTFNIQKPKKKIFLILSLFYKLKKKKTGATCPRSHKGVPKVKDTNPGSFQNKGVVEMRWDGVTKEQRSTLCQEVSRALTLHSNPQQNRQQTVLLPPFRDQEIDTERLRNLPKLPPKQQSQDSNEDLYDHKAHAPSQLAKLPPVTMKTTYYLRASSFEFLQM